MLCFYIVLCVKVSNVLGKENGGIYVLFSGLNIERALGTAGCIG